MILKTAPRGKDVRLIVREDQNDRLFYDHELTKIENLDASSESGAASNKDVGQSGAHQGKSKMLQSIFSVNPETVSEVVDENGEPMVVHHGIESEFDVFNASPKNRSHSHPSRMMGFLYQS